MSPTTVAPKQDVVRRTGRFLAVRKTTEALAAPLSAEDQMVQSMPDCSPTKWHLAHSTWFFETFLLEKFSAGYRSFDPEFKFLFNSYYKTLGGHPERSTRGLRSRPPLSRVLEYRKAIDAQIAELLSRTADPEVLQILETGLHHEQQHQELILTDIKHALWSNPLRPAYLERPTQVAAASAPLAWTESDGGLIEIGHTGEGFCFDNELPRHRVWLDPFRLASRLVTNREYLEFIADGGYKRPELWLSDGWDVVCAEKWNAPLYWEEIDRAPFAFTLNGLQSLQSNEPVCHVSYYEADAFARWAGKRLPTEAEWELVASSNWIAGNFQESRRFHPAPALGSAGIEQLFGDVWEWTASAYLPYPRFQPATGALGEYNGKFMCNQFVLRGGSCATPEAHIRATYRNFFPPHARWQFMGLRLADDRN